ncbi:MAG: Holliday junction branch migration protein RuvA [Patescibacteria group bacterium]|nr:Holliday junction branch migration protein RuvA [Patescibacteria group bacterium]
MIAHLKGIILNKGSNFLVLDTGSVGYKVFVPATLLLKYKSGSTLEVHVYTYVREDQMSLYGFSSPSELELFELLISVSGVGPKMALAILSSTSPEHVKSAIAGGEAAVFTKVSGVGRKTAERLIMELKEKLDGGPGISSKLSKEFSESLDALVALGYSSAEAREALKRVPAELASSGQIVREALRFLGGK